MHVRKVLVYVCALAAVAACKLPVPVPQPPDASDYPSDGGAVTEEPEGSPAALSSPCGKACKTFERLKCPEAKPSDTGVSCYQVCLKGARLRKIPSACWAAAQSVSALRACGGVRCVP